MEDGGPADHTRPAALENPTIVFDSERGRRARALPRGTAGLGVRRRASGGSTTAALTWRSDIAGRVRWAAAGGEPLIPGLWPYVEAMRCPTLVVRGAESPLFKAEYAERMTP